MQAILAKFAKINGFFMQKNAECCAGHASRRQDAGEVDSGAGGNKLTCPGFRHGRKALHGRLEGGGAAQMRGLRPGSSRREQGGKSPWGRQATARAHSQNSCAPFFRYASVTGGPRPARYSAPRMASRSRPQRLMRA